MTMPMDASATVLEEAHPRRVTQSLLRGLRTAAIAAVLVVGSVLLARNWGSVVPALQQLSPSYWLPALMSALAAMLCATQSWRVVLNGLGSRQSLTRSMPVFLVGQLGKYVPGSVWAYVLQVELGRRVGLARARVATATLASSLIAVVATLMMSLLAVPAIVGQGADLGPLVWAYALVPVCLVLLHPRVLRAVVGTGLRLFGKPNTLPLLSVRTVAASLLWALISSVLFGVHLWLLASSAPGIGVQDLGRCVGTIAAAMMAGLLVLFLPSGLGVREVVMYAGLLPMVGPTSALAITAVSRALMTLGDLLAAGLSAVVGWRDLRRHPVTTTTDDAVPAAGAGA